MFSQEPIEWPEEIEILIDRLESESSERALSREERALMDVYETVPVLESEEGLHGFWHSGVNHQRVIKSFDLIGADSLVDPQGQPMVRDPHGLTTATTTARRRRNTSRPSRKTWPPDWTNWWISCWRSWRRS
ncbi:MAG: hypothetical protein H7A49_03155 [Akkermansiaceae bacterium]|nr:hypothetical protein [Akkermansiaceae bacterium]